MLASNILVPLSSPPRDFRGDGFVMDDPFPAANAASAGFAARVVIAAGGGDGVAGDEADSVVAMVVVERATGVAGLVWRPG